MGKGSVWYFLLETESQRRVHGWKNLLRRDEAGKRFWVISENW